MKRMSRLKLLDEREGSGTPAKKGDEVLLNEKQAEHLPKEMIRVEDGVILIDRTVTLGRREVIAGVEHALMGMRVGGYRKVRISPHLAYRDKGVPDLISADAVLIVEIRLREIIQKRTVHAS